MPKNKIVDPIDSDSVIVPQVKRAADFVQFVQWYAMSEDLREPKNQKDFAEMIGVSPDTLTDWKKRPEFWTSFQRAIGQSILEKIPEVIDGLVFRASNKGDAKEVELCLRLAGILINNNK